MAALFQNGPEATHAEVVDGYIDVAVAALAARTVYLSVLDPQTPVIEQARRQVDLAVPTRAGGRVVQFIVERGSSR